MNSHGIAESIRRAQYCLENPQDCEEFVDIWDYLTKEWFFNIQSDYARELLDAYTGVLSTEIAGAIANADGYLLERWLGRDVDDIPRDEI